jgi:Protein of unknown function (DUF1997)
MARSCCHNGALTGTTVTTAWSIATTTTTITRMILLCVVVVTERTQAFVIRRPPPSSSSLSTSILTSHDTHRTTNRSPFLHSRGESSREFRWNLSFQPRSAVPLSRRTTRSASALFATSSSTNRKVLLSRTGPHFKVDRISGKIEFGATANLVTQLPPSPEQPSTTNMIDLWLLDENRGLAMSIWDPKLMKDLGNNIYRLQIMTLQFVTITLAPWVDVQMVTTTTVPTNDKQSQKPEFIVQSIGFDPNIQILPGMRINGNALGIVIDVAGVLRPGADGTSVTGAIAFQTSGNLPPPLRILPDAILKSASDTINTTIVNFAIQSFQKGAKMNYQQFVQQYEESNKKKRETELANVKTENS